MEVLSLFSVDNPIADEVIESNTAPLFDLRDDVFLIIPSYMAWCLRHDHSDGNIVIDGTISALSELGRTEHVRSGYRRFKFECTELQREAVIEFLEWCLSIEGLLNEHTERAIKQWRKPLNKEL
jgi:hypothetical protein